MKNIKQGLRVEHDKLGAGTVLEVKSNSEVIVEFDNQSKGYDKTLRVAIDYLKAIK